MGILLKGKQMILLIFNNALILSFRNLIHTLSRDGNCFILFQILKPANKKPKYTYAGLMKRPITPPVKSKTDKEQKARSNSSNIKEIS